MTLPGLLELRALMTWMSWVPEPPQGSTLTCSTTGFLQSADLNLST